MKNLIGKWLIALALLLLTISFIFFGEPLRQILAEGNIAATNSTNVKLTALFFTSGIIMLIIGVIVDGRSRKQQ